METIKNIFTYFSLEGGYITSSHVFHIFNSLILLLSVWFLKNLFRRRVRKLNWRTEEKRKWYVSIRNWSTLITLIGLISIWSTEIQTFAVSVVAITAALIISGKELILCIHGGLLRTFNGLFKVGDRIEIKGIRGDVIDTGLMATKIIEIGPQNFTHQFTGRSISIPNSLFLTNEVINETFINDYVLHVFKVPLKRTENWQEAEDSMMKAANKVCTEFLDPAQESMNQTRFKEEIEIPHPRPRITYRFPNSSEIEMIVRIPAPASRKGSLEQAVLREFMQSYLCPLKK